MFDRKIIEQVITLWNRSPDVRKPAPPFPVVKNLMETVFLAGLHREEERPVQVTVSLMAPEEFPHRGPAGDSVLLSLEKHQPFTVNSLMKLAPAFDPVTTALAVCCVGEGEPCQLEIWGAIFTSTRGGGRFDTITLSLAPPEVLTISSKKTGALTVYRGSEVIARFNGGRFSEPIPTPFSANLMGWWLLHGIRPHPEFKRNGMEYWDVYRDFLNHLLVEASSRGVGGAIIWLPEKMADGTRRGILPRHVLSGSPEGAPLLEDLCRMESKLKQSVQAVREGKEAANCLVMEETVLECKRRIVEHAEILAQLTRVDGALIISSRLRAISFGSVLAAPLWEGETMHGIDEEDCNLYPVNLVAYGTRHSSAVNFVGWNSGAVAFVLSQDGPITGLARKDDDTVYWWPDCLGKHRLPGQLDYGPFGS
ncbi:MAG: hypothetical protein HQL80_03685 [Magnetococcales bacterium]|nr:hypothetical protein [Magnetococcales bacterium]